CWVGLYIYVCDAGRADCLGDWVGPDPGVCVQQYERQRWVCGTCGGAAGLDGAPAVAEVVVAGLSAAGAAGPARQGHLPGWMACWVQHPRVPDCSAADGRAG